MLAYSRSACETSISNWDQHCIVVLMELWVRSPFTTEQEPTTNRNVILLHEKHQLKRFSQNGKTNTTIIAEGCLANDVRVKKDDVYHTQGIIMFVSCVSVFDYLPVKFVGRCLLDS